MDDRSHKIVILLFLIVPSTLAVFGYAKGNFEVSDIIHFLLAFCILCAMLLIHKDAEENKKKSDKILHNQFKEYRLQTHTEEKHVEPEKENRDILKVTAGRKIGDSYALLGAQRVPYTTFTLTTGNKDVYVEKIFIQQMGTDWNPNFKRISLIDQNGISIAHIERTDEYTGHEECFTEPLQIQKNSSITLVVAADITDDVRRFIPNIIAGFTIEGIITNTKMEGNFPIHGARHQFTDSLTLQRAEIELKKNNFSIKLPSDKKVAEESGYLRYIQFEFENESSDLENIKLITSELEYPIEVNAGEYFVLFPRRGLYIREGEKKNMSIVSTKNKDIKIKEVQDVYIVGTSYGYGLPVDTRKGGFI